MTDYTPVMLLHIRADQLPEPTPEFTFARPRKWRFDLAWPDEKLALEIEGATWANGRHVRGAGYEADCLKYSTAAILGWRVIRVTPKMIDSGLAIDLLKQAFDRG